MSSSLLDDLLWELDSLQANGCEHGFKPAKYCLQHNTSCDDAFRQIEIEQYLASLNG